MPLRDHFRPPLDNLRHWESLPGGVAHDDCRQSPAKLPRRYFAELRVHSGASAEIDVAAFEEEGEEILAVGNGTSSSGAIAAAVWCLATDTRPRH